MLLYAAYLGWYVLAVIFQILVITLDSLRQTVGYINNLVNCILERENKSKNLRPLRRNLNASLRILRQLRVIQPLQDEALFNLMPSIFSLGHSILIFSNVATVKYFGTIPMPFFLVMPTLSLFVVIIVASIFPPASDVYEGSVEFLKRVQWSKLVNTNEKDYRRMVRAARPLRMDLGLFFAKRSTKTTYFCSCLDNTVNVLLL